MDRQQPGQVITFYSYKGGTGRTMSLANVACLLARDRRRLVLAVDWDLEAPGLHHYLGSDAAGVSGSDGDPRAPGVVELFAQIERLSHDSAWQDVWDATEGKELLEETVDLDAYVVETHVPGLQMVKAGRFDDDYVLRTNTFNWEGLFHRVPWIFQALAEAWADRYAYVLVDSRTGQTDASGISTMQLPEKLVAVFTPNNQSLTGIADLVQKAVAYRRRSFDLRPLVVFPLVSRVEPSKARLDKVWRYGDEERSIPGYQPQMEKILKQAYALPHCDLTSYFNEVFVQHVSTYAYGEGLAVLAPPKGDNLVLARRYQSLARRLVTLDGPWQFHVDAESISSRAERLTRSPVREEKEVSPAEEVSAVPEESEDLYSLSPYRGLQPFREQDAAFFFGRDRENADLWKAAQGEPLVVLVGGSGSGKSSVARAGVLPQARAAGWAIASFRLGANPIHNLVDGLLAGRKGGFDENELRVQGAELVEQLYAGRLSLSELIGDLLETTESQRLLLLADQFDELYTLVPALDRRTVFIDILLEAVATPGWGCLFLTMRADFLGDALNYRPFADALQHFQQNLKPMEREALREAIEKPAAVVGMHFESGLVGRILDDVESGAGSLPLLEFALTLLWERNVNGLLLHDAYDEIGGIEGALAGHTERVFANLNEDEQQQARRLFVQLIQVGLGTADSRRLATRRELAGVSWDLVARLADARLVVTSVTKREDDTREERVEIGHEALIQQWDRLRGWIEEDRTFLLWQERLRAAVRQWEANERDEGALLRGAALAEAEGWLVARGEEIGEREQAYITASIHLRDQEVAEQEARLVRELEQARQLAEEQEARAKAEAEQAILASERLNAERRRRFAYALAAVLGLLIIVALVSLSFANRSRVVAVTARVDAEQSAKVAMAAEATAIAARATSENYARLSVTRQGQIAALSTEVASLQSAFRPADSEAAVESVATNPDESILLLGYAGAPGEIRTADERELLASLPGQLAGSEFTADGTLLLAYEDAPGELRDSADGTLITTLSDQLADWSYSPEGSRFLLLYPSAPAELRSSVDGSLFRDFPQEVVAGEFSPEGSRFLLLYADEADEIRQAVDGALITTRTDEIADWIFSPEGSRLLLVYADLSGELLHPVNGESVTTLSGEIRYGQFSPEESRLLLSYVEAPGELWDAADGVPLATLTGEMVGSEFSPDGDVLLVDYLDAPGELLEPADGELLASLSGRLFGWAFSADGSRLLVEYFDAPGELRDLADGGSPVVSLSGRLAGWQFSPDGAVLLLDYVDETDELRNAADGSVLTTLAGEVDSWEFDPEQEALKVNYVDGRSELRSTKDGSLITP